MEPVGVIAITSVVNALFKMSSAAVEKSLRSLATQWFVRTSQRISVVFRIISSFIIFNLSLVYNKAELLFLFSINLQNLDQEPITALEQIYRGPKLNIYYLCFRNTDYTD